MFLAWNLYGKTSAQATKPKIDKQEVLINQALLHGKGNNQQGDQHVGMKGNTCKHSLAKVLISEYISNSTQQQKNENT